MSKTTAIKARQKGVRGYIYVGRPSRWGNPYTVAEHGREGAVRQYRAWLSRRMAEEGGGAFAAALRALKGQRLGCTCPQEDIDAGQAPGREGEEPRCHATALARFVDERFPVSGAEGR